MEFINWRKSAHSSPNGENCVELASIRDSVVVRDSKNPEGPRLVFQADEFRAFISRVKEL
jgi:hypothetical protein